MEDNWSQLRLASLHAARALLTAVPEPDRHLYWPRLLPRLCVNRFYVAEGVKSAAADAWRSAVGPRGRETVAAHVAAVAAHYVVMMRASNHMVGEAALQAVSEVIGWVLSAAGNGRRRDACFHPSSPPPPSCPLVCTHPPLRPVTRPPVRWVAAGGSGGPQCGRGGQDAEGGKALGGS